MQTLGRYKTKVGEEEKDFACTDATKANLAVDEDSKKATEEAEERLAPVVAFLTDVLKAPKVVVSTRLTESPAAMVQGEYGMSPSMQRYMQAQAVAMGGEDDAEMAGMMGSMNQSVLEINPDHAIVEALARMVASDDTAGATTYGKLLMDLASITSGYSIEDPKGFSDRLVKIMGMVGQEGGGVQDATVV